MTTHWLKVLGATVVMLGLVCCTAQASSITFTLNCSMTAVGTCGAPTGSFGTITVADDVVDSNWVDVTVNLTSPTGRVVNKFFLNYFAAGFPIPSGYAFSAVGTTVAASQDNEGQGIYGMAFDLVFNPGLNPFTTVLKLQKPLSPDINLNASDFDVTDANGLLYAAVNYSGAGPQEGATLSDHGVSVTAVPEPGTLSLVGMAMFGLFQKRRRSSTRVPNAPI
jgi:hypothetical protein